MEIPQLDFRSVTQNRYQTLNSSRTVSSFRPFHSRSQSSSQFLKSTTEIRTELSKLSNACRNTTPFSHSRTPIKPQKTEREDPKWTLLNSLLNKRGFSKVQEGDLNSLLEILITLLTETPTEKEQSTSSSYNTAEAGMSPCTEEENIFESFMHREFNPSKEDDIKVLGIITMYEEEMKLFKKKSEPEFMQSASISPIKKPSYSRKLNFEFKSKEPNNLKVPFSQFVHNVYNTLFEEPLIELNEETLNSLQCEVVKYKKAVKSQLKLKSEVTKALGIPRDSDSDTILHNCSAVPYFKKLFGNSGEIITDIDNMFLFVHEMKSFLHHMRRALKLPVQSKPSQILHKVKSLIN